MGKTSTFINCIELQSELSSEIEDIDSNRKSEILQVSIKYGLKTAFETK